ncbi:MAG: hypothetical protein KGJ13_11060 [Patescibacteria group bacterium]|nr:hypothetical protein [Patescibacteria group bacterium]
MPWIKSHTVLVRHRKVIELARALRIKPVYLLGHLHALWHSALEQQEDGDLSSWSDDMIASAACFDGECSRFVSLLQAHGWLDGRILHDWLDHAGRYLTDRYRTANPEKLQKIFAAHGLKKEESVSSQTKVRPDKMRLDKKQITTAAEPACGAPLAVDLSKIIPKKHKTETKDYSEYRLHIGKYRGVYAANIPHDEAQFLLDRVGNLGQSERAALQWRVDLKKSESQR